MQLKRNPGMGCLYRQKRYLDKSTEVTTMSFRDRTSLF